MRIRTLALALAVGAATFGGVAAAEGDGTTIYFQMEGACNTDPPRSLQFKQNPDWGGACFPVDAGTAGQAGAATEVYNSGKALGGMTLAAGDQITGEFRFMNFFEVAGAPGPSVGVMDFAVEVTARIGGKTVVLVDYAETNSPVAGTEKIFTFTGEVPEGGVLRNMTATVTASGNTALAMGFDHSHAFFTIG